VRVSRKGAFGEVRMCVHRETGAQRAVKVLRKSHMDDDEKRMLFNEINILKEIVSDFSFRTHLPNYVLQYPLFDSPNFVPRTTRTSSRCTSSSKTRSATTS